VRAAVLERFGAPLVVREVPDAAPGPGEVLLRVRAAGICRTDLKIIDGAIPTVRPPLIPGHEPAGEVAAVGSGVEGVAIGTRVAASLDISCRSCHYCRRGEYDHCARLQRLGFERDGALAEFMTLPAANLVELPESIPFEIGATLADAVGSSYHAVVTRARVRPAQTVAVYGLGGLGLVAVQVAVLSGARVIAIARDGGRRDLAQQLGATWGIDPSHEDISERVRELTGGIGVHAFFDFVGIEGSVEAGARSCRKGGAVVVVGYQIPQLVTSMTALVYDEISILGSRGSTRSDLIEAVSLVDQGVIRPVVARELSLGEVNDGLRLLREGAVTGRIVVRP
jgi:D-arabinose 1-dehydrogenase-like Zn-dependent alcohol dehydrogenase